MRLMFGYWLNVVARLVGIRKMPPREKGKFRLLATYPPPNEPVFIILNPTWPDPPSAWFGDIDEATSVAQSLAMKQPEDTFFIMKGVRTVSSKTIPELLIKELPGAK